MKIGFYKPFIKIFFHDDRMDFNATSYEVVNVMKIFAKHGHQCYILSESDLQENITNNIHKGSLSEKYDRIFLYGGPFALMKDDGNIIQQLRKLTDRLDYMLTDIRCVPPSDIYYNLFDNFYSQSTKSELFGQKNIYGAVAEFRCYNMNIPNIEEIVKNKDIEIYFGGTTRGRLKKYLEYVYRPNIMLTGKSEVLDFNNRVTRDEYFRILNKTKYSIVFVDLDYEVNNFITPRFYENVEFGIMNFVDIEWDNDQVILEKDDFCRVENYLEWMNKIKIVNNDYNRYIQELKFQQSKVRKEFVTGEYVYEVLSK